MLNPNNSFIRYIIQHKTAANILMIAVLVMGLVSASLIRKQFFPDTINETINVSIPWSGAGAKDIDYAINAPLINALQSVDGVEEATASARQGSANIQLDFEDGWNMQQALSDVETQIATVELPNDADDPKVSIYAWRDRVADVVISGPVRTELLVQYGDELTELLGRDEITKVSLTGIASPEIRIDVTIDNLRRYNLSMTDIASQVEPELSPTPSGEIEQLGVYLVTGKERTTAEDIGAIEIRDGNNRLIQLSDIANVYSASLNSNVEYLHNGNPAIILQVDRDARGDTVETQKELESIIESYRPTLPQTIDVSLTKTRADAINDRLSILMNNAYMGLSLVLVLLFIFLSARSAFWVAAGIPIALAGAIAMMYAFGVTINMISLFGLIICLGIIVDDAIVVAEHADTLHKSGMRAIDATTSAVKKMFAPVFTASLTTILAFSALTLIGGRFGRFIIDIPVTVVFVVIASFLECFIILPAHLYHSLKRYPKKRTLAIDRISEAFGRWFDKITNRFKGLIGHIIRWRYPIVVAALGILLISIAQITTGRLGFVFFNAPERSVVSANIAMQGGTSRSDTRAQLEEMEKALIRTAAKFEQDYSTNPVLFSMSTLGENVGRSLPSAQYKSHDELGGYSVELIDPDLRPYSAFEFLGAWQKDIVRSPFLEQLSLRGSRSGPSGDAVDIQLQGHDSTVLKNAAERVKSKLSAIAGVSAIEDNLNYDKPELVITINKRGEELGITTDRVARELRQQVNRLELKSFATGRRSTTITLGLAESELNPNYLDNIQVKTDNNSMVYLNDVVNTSYELGFANITREDGSISVRISADYDTNDEVGYNALVSTLQNDILPQISSEYGLNWQLLGLQEQQREFFADSGAAFTLCIMGIFIVLAWVFSSFSQAAMLLLIIPFGVIGMVWGHVLHDIPMSMLSIIGFIGMAGIVINDSIVLVTTIDELAQDRPINRAIAEGSASRLRAVLLTTLTTVFGLAPLLFETSRQAQFLLPTVITLAYGLSVGMIMVLIITPCFMAILNDIQKNMRATRHMLRYLTRRPS